MTKLTDEQYKKIFGEYKGSIVIEKDSNPEITRESSNDLATITMNLVAPGQLMDVGNIPTLEYIKDINLEVKANADAIMANYHNRSIEQTQLVNDVINDEDSLVESAVLWLEVINSNLNQLMGLVSVNNYLLGMSGLPILQDNYLLGMSGLPILQDADLSVESYKSEEDMHREKYPENFAIIVGVMGSGAGIGSLAGPLGTIVGAILLPILYLMLVTEDAEPKEAVYPENINYDKFGSYDYKDPRNPSVGGSGTSSYLYYETLSTFIGNKDDKINYPSWLPSSEYEKYAENYGDKPVTEKSETNNLQSIATQELTGLAKAVLSIEQLDMFKTHTTSGTIIAQKYESGARMSSKQSLTVPENKTSTNAVTKEDLDASTYSQNKYGPQQIEYIITVPVEINTTVNEAEKFDMDQILSTIGPEVENKIYGFISTQGLRGALDR